MAYNSLQSLRMYVVESLLSNYRLVPECHTYPEDQMRTCVIGLTACRILTECVPSVCMASSCKWQVGVHVVGALSEDSLICC